jgi:hypothetical protein
MRQRSIRFFVVAGSLMLYIADHTGLARAQADFSPADSDLGAEAYAPHALANGADAQGDGRDAESSWYAGTDMDQQSALAPCAMAVERGQPCGDLEGVDAATDSPFAPELVPWAGQAQQTWSNSPFPALSSEDREAIGRVAYAEAGNQGEEGIAAVIFTILNRVSSGQFQDSVQGVIDAPNQFEPATRAGGWRYLPPLDLTQSIQFETILNLILAGWLPIRRREHCSSRTRGSSPLARRRAWYRRTSSTLAARRRSQRFAITASMTHAQRPIYPPHVGAVRLKTWRPYWRPTACRIGTKAKMSFSR